MPPGSCSVTNLGGERWLRNVAANPNFELDAFATAMKVALRGLGIP
jgi:hypothetical protein